MDIAAFLLDSVPSARLLGISFDSVGSGGPSISSTRPVPSWRH
ncbi:hypothetical protein ACFHYQ_10185 [Sphaerimonospora cavernae]|uniref:Uncharacterized protein n=1 Tax=Sphaerimonospora cavernae TaxID=1740611 RepID=A0ABV6U3T4_9ACTN